MLSKIYINCDGGARGNPGSAAIGVTIRDEKDDYLERFKKTIGRATNNVAEYHGLIKALELAAKYTRKEVVVIMDSELIIKQMRGEYIVKSLLLKPLFLEAKELAKNFEKVTYKHVSRWDKFQRKADELVNQALDGV